MARLSLSLLGPFAATLDGELVSGFLSNKVRALLAYLATEMDRRRPETVAHRRESLTGLLWPDQPERSARTNLNNALSNLRSIIGDRQAVPPYLLVSREAIQFSRASDARVDVVEFGRLAEPASPEAGSGAAASGLASRLEEAVTLYRGAFLEGFSLKDSPAFEHWALVTREQVQRQAMAALRWLSAHYAQRGEYERAVAHARRQVELEPWEEQAQRELMRLLALTGQRSAALAQYEACVRALKEELDVEPAADTTRLLEQIRHGTLASPTPAAPTATLARGDAADAGLPTWMVAESGPRHNLPAQVASFVGREQELDELRHLLSDPAVRLVTAIGPGGMGKTRLAVEVARAALDQTVFAEAWLVELAPVVDNTAVPRAVAAALGVHEQPDRPLPETIAGALQERRLLLLLDNCEHLLDGAAQLASLLPSRCSQLTVLATSREPLHVPGEHLYEVPPMALPASSDPAGQLLDADAVQLFCRRAAEVRPGFALDASSAPLAAELCRRLDGMPLAIELAAARLRALSLAEVARRLDDRFRLLTGGSRTALPRQQTLHNTVEWSYDLLGVAEQTLFDCLSVFAGSFSLAAAEAVCSGDGVRKEGVLDLLTALVDRSLVSRVEGTDGTARYRLLETLRAYGQERLSEQGEADAVAARHAGYYVSLAEAEEPVLWTFEKEMISALHRLDAETENLAAAMRWALARGQPEVAIRIGGALHAWTLYRPHYAQYAEWLRRALAQGEGVAPLYRAKALDVITTFAEWWGRGDEVVAIAQAELELARAAGEGKWVAVAMLSMADAARVKGDHDRARAYWREGAELARQYDERVLDLFASLALTNSEPPAQRQALLAELLPQAPYVLQSRVHQLLALTARALGDLERALAHAQQSLAGYTMAGDIGMQTSLLVHLAEIAALHGDHARAGLLLERGRDLSRQLGHYGQRQLGHYGQVIWAMREMGLLAWQQGDLEKACSRFQECLDLAHEQQYNQEAALARTGLALVSCEQGKYDQAGALCQQARHDLPDWDDEAQAFALCVQGRIALGRGQAARAIEWYRAALAYLRPGESRPDIVEVLEFLAWALAADGQHAEGSRLLAFAERERVDMGIVLPPVDRPHHERALHAVRAALDETAFAAAWAAGQALDMEGAVALALPDARGSGR